MTDQALSLKDRLMNFPGLCLLLPAVMAGITEGDHLLIQKALEPGNMRIVTAGATAPDQGLMNDFAPKISGCMAIIADIVCSSGAQRSNNQ